MGRAHHPQAAHEAVQRLLTEIREEAGLSQRELAHRVGRPHQSFIGKLEAGHSYLNALDLRLILRACGTDPGDFFRRLDELIAAEEQ